MAPLDEHDRELLDGYKATITPSNEEMQSTWEAIAGRVEHEHGARRSGWLPWLGVAAAVVAVVSYVELGAMLAGPAANDVLPVQSFDQAASEPESEEVTPLPGAIERRDAPAPALSPAPAASEDPPMSLEAEPAAAPPPVEPPARARPARSSKTARAPERTAKREHAMLDVGAELRLLERARAALAAEDFAQVLALANRHTREHPGGAMREELAMLRVVALCAVGPKARWQAAHRRFEREFPGSPLRTHLRDDCTP